jgi:hypothetical protein
MKTAHTHTFAPIVSQLQWKDAKAHPGIPRSIGGGCFIASNRDGDFLLSQWGKRARAQLKRELRTKNNF